MGVWGGGPHHRPRAPPKALLAGGGSKGHAQALLQRETEKRKKRESPHTFPVCCPDETNQEPLSLPAARRGSRMDHAELPRRSRGNMGGAARVLALGLAMGSWPLHTVRPAKGCVSAKEIFSWGRNARVRPVSPCGGEDMSGQLVRLVSTKVLFPCLSQRVVLLQTTGLFVTGWGGSASEVGACSPACCRPLGTVIDLDLT